MVAVFGQVEQTGGLCPEENVFELDTNFSNDVNDLARAVARAVTNATGSCYASALLCHAGANLEVNHSSCQCPL